MLFLEFNELIDAFIYTKKNNLSVSISHTHTHLHTKRIIKHFTVHALADYLGLGVYEF